MAAYKALPDSFAKTHPRYMLTGFACAWYYRKNLTSSARNLWMQGILPVTGGLMLFLSRP